jgi:hypothetical protein
MAARHLMKRWGVEAKDSVFLCDDDNDLELAVEVGRAFLPTITSVSQGRRSRRRRRSRGPFSCSSFLPLTPLCVLIHFLSPLGALSSLMLSHSHLCAPTPAAW